MYDRIVTQDGLTCLAALDDLATCGDLAQRTRVSWRATVTRPIALDAPTRSNRLRHPRSLAYVRKSKIKDAAHDGFATHDGLMTFDGFAARGARPRA